MQPWCMKIQTNSLNNNSNINRNEREWYVWRLWKYTPEGRNTSPYGTVLSLRHSFNWSFPLFFPGSLSSKKGTWANQVPEPAVLNSPPELTAGPGQACTGRGGEEQGISGKNAGGQHGGTHFSCTFPLTSKFSLECYLQQFLLGAIFLCQGNTTDHYSF